MIRHISAVFKKQAKDTLKNRTVLIQFVMFPMITLLMTRTIGSVQIEENFFVTLFASMYISMAPLTVMAAILSEEKEKNTLRILRMAGVKPGSYLIGVGGQVLLFCLAGSAVICFCGVYTARERIWFMAIMAAGILISLMIGAAIGTFSRTQMMATSLTVPIMLLLSFLPMLSLFNTVIRRFSRFLYSDQILSLLKNPGHPEGGIKGPVILVLNMAAAFLVFSAAWRRCELA